MSGSKIERKVIRTVIVDDSAFVRKIVREMLSGSAQIEVVGMARDGEEALAMVQALKPDVVTCDLAMPTMDGVEFVRRQMARHPIPILILTASPEECDQVIEAINAGAVDFIHKPTALTNRDLFKMRLELVEKVIGAARVSVPPASSTLPEAVISIARHPPLKVDAIVLGISTGGPQALRYLLPKFPADFPVPIAIVLHMPLGYTALFAEKLNEICQLKVQEVRDGAVMEPGVALLGRAGRHLTFRRNSHGAVLAHLASQPTARPHCPSVDVMFESAAQTYKSRLLAVVMTGMGDDGKKGCAWIKAEGGRVLTESEESCVIYGMPRSVFEAGLSDKQLPLGKMVEQIMKDI